MNDLVASADLAAVLDRRTMTWAKKNSVHDLFIYKLVRTVTQLINQVVCKVQEMKKKKIENQFMLYAWIFYFLAGRAERRRIMTFTSGTLVTVKSCTACRPEKNPSITIRSY